MTTKITPALLLLAGAIAAPSALAEKASFSFRDFDAVHAAAGVNVVLKQGAFSISAEGSDKALERLSITQDGDTLKVTHKSGNWSFGGFKGAVVTITAPSFASLHAGSGADVIGRDLQFADLSAQTSGGGDMTLSGQCRTLKIASSGGADFNGDALRCETVDVRTSGGADATVFATGKAMASASGGSDIRILGAPSDIQKDTSGGADIRVS
jgi:hypothetical protein